MLVSHTLAKFSGCVFCKNCPIPTSLIIFPSCELSDLDTWPRLPFHSVHTRAYSHKHTTNNCPKSLNLPCPTAAQVLTLQFHPGERTMPNSVKNFKELTFHNTLLFIWLSLCPHDTMSRDMRLMNYCRGTIIQWLHKMAAHSGHILFTYSLIHFSTNFTDPRSKDSSEILDLLPCTITKCTNG